MYQTQTFQPYYAVKTAAPAIGWQINLRLFNRILMAAIAAGLIAFLIGNNDLAAKSFVLKDVKNNLSDLTWQNKILETKVTALGSYQYLSQKSERLQFVPANDIKYLPAGESSIAKR